MSSSSSLSEVLDSSSSSLLSDSFSFSLSRFLPPFSSRSLSSQSSPSALFIDLRLICSIVSKNVYLYTRVEGSEKHHQTLLLLKSDCPPDLDFLCAFLRIAVGMVPP